jgi:hypothetical protein
MTPSGGQPQPNQVVAHRPPLTRKETGMTTTETAARMRPAHPGATQFDSSNNTEFRGSEVRQIRTYEVSDSRPLVLP